MSKIPREKWPEIYNLAKSGEALSVLSWRYAASRGTISSVIKKYEADLSAQGQEQEESGEGASQGQAKGAGAAPKVPEIAPSSHEALSRAPTDKPVRAAPKKAPKAGIADASPAGPSTHTGPRRQTQASPSPLRSEPDTGPARSQENPSPATPAEAASEHGAGLGRTTARLSASNEATTSNNVTRPAKPHGQQPPEIATSTAVNAGARDEAGEKGGAPTAAPVQNTTPIIGPQPAAASDTPPESKAPQVRSSRGILAITPEPAPARPDAASQDGQSSQKRPYRETLTMSGLKGQDRTVDVVRNPPGGLGGSSRDSKFAAAEAALFKPSALTRVNHDQAPERLSSGAPRADTRALLDAANQTSTHYRTWMVSQSPTSKRQARDSIHQMRGILAKMENDLVRS